MAEDERRLRDGRTIDWIDGAVELIDQTLLPDEQVVLRLTTHGEVVDAIGRLAVRGAPAIGVAGAMAVALAARTLRPDEVPVAVDHIRSARPTAVNLARMVDRVAAALDGGADAVLDAALAVRDEELAASAAMATLGADLVEELVEELVARSDRATDEPIRIMTICNTGGLAAVEGGTALAVALEVHRRGRLAEVLALETRPLLQGARLTAWELDRARAPHRVVTDGAAPFLLSRGHADVVLAGADRIAANGDVANKIGTYSLALGAQAASIPFVVVAPESTVDVATPSGEAVAIEERDPDEVLSLRGVRLAPPGSSALNPAFDVTPARLVTAIVTDRRVVRPAAGDRL